MMRISHRVAALLLTSWCLVSISLADMDVRRYPYQRDLVRDPTGTAAVGSFQLDHDLYSALASDFANLRLLDQAGAETPFHLRRRTHRVSRRVETSRSLLIQDFEGPAETVGRIIVRLEDPLHSAAGVIIHTGNRNFEKTVSIYGSDDRNDWVPLAEAARIYDYSRFIDVRNVRIDIPSNSVRYLRIDIADMVEERAGVEFERTTERRGDSVFSEIERRRMREEVIRVDRIEVRSIHETVVPDEPYKATALITNWVTTADAKTKTSVWTFETDRQPLVSLSLLTPSRNFSRQAVLEGRRIGERSGWVRLGSARVHHLDLDVVRDHQLTIPLNRPSRHGQYRMTIYNEDNPPLELSGLIATSQVHEVVFVADSSNEYRVLYGGEDITAPRYDTGILLAGVPSIETVIYHPGPREPNPAHEARIRSGSMSPRVLFGIAMASMILLLAWLIAKGAGKIEAEGGGKA